MSRHGWTAVGLLWCCVAVTPVVGQEPTPPPTGTTVPAAETPPTVESLTTRIEAAKSSTDLDETVRKQVVETLQSALTSLTEGQRFESTLAALERQVTEAPKRLLEIETALQKPLVELKEPKRSVSLDSLQTRLSDAQALLTNEEQRLAALESELERRAKRRNEAPARLATVRQQLSELVKQIDVPPPESTPTSRAARQALLAKRDSLEHERRLLEREVAAYDATSRLVVAERDLATQAAAAARKKVVKLQQWVNERRRLEARENAREAEELVETVQPEVQPLARELQTFAEELVEARATVAMAITESAGQIRETEKRTEQLVGEFNGLVERAEKAGFNNALGLLLRKHRSGLPDVRSLRAEIDRRQEQMSELHLERIEYENLRQSNVDLATLVDEATDALVPADAPRRKEVEVDVRAVLVMRRRFLASAIDDANTLLDQLSALDTAQRVLVQRSVEQQSYIAEHILWVRSARPLGPEEFTPALDAVTWIVRGGRTLGDRLVDDALANWPIYTIGLLTFLFLLPWQQRFRAQMRLAGDEASKRTTTTMRPTNVALAYTLLVAAFWPLVIGAIGWRIRELGGSTDFVRSFGRSLVTICGLWLGLEIFRGTCRPRGLGRAHFGWPEKAVNTARGALHQVILFALPPAAISLLFQHSAIEAYINSIGRAGLIVSLLVTALASHRILRPSGNVLEYAIGGDSKSWLARTRYLWHPVGVGVPLLLALMAGFGYNYTARQLAYRLIETIALVIVVLMINALFKRWLLLAHRRLAIRRAREKRAAQITEARAKATGDEYQVPPEDLSAVLEDPAISLAASNAQIRVLFQAVFAVVSLFGVWWIWSSVLPAFGILDRVQLWTSAYPGGDVDGVEAVRWVTLGSVLIAVVVVFVTTVAARNLPGLLGFTVLSRLPLDAGARYAWSAVCGYAIIVSGVISVFRVLGVSWESVQWLVAAMTVGLGFGLQEIFANFVSGLIILFERPIRVGDTVTVGSVTGTVARIRIRATTIIDWDRKELVVPNREFVTGQLVNWTLSDPVLRLICNVGVAYGSDVRLAKKLLHQIAANHQHVLKEPAPNVIFVEFGDSTLNFELRVFVSSIHLYRTLKDELNTLIDDAFRENDVEIAFPQRDLHLRTVDGAIPLRNVADPSDHGNGDHRRRTGDPVPSDHDPERS